MAADSHPMHAAMEGPLFIHPAKPVRASWLLQRRLERACRKRGGHWWHADKGMIDWFCCQCGAERDGMPKDGE